MNESVSMRSSIKQKREQEVLDSLAKLTAEVEAEGYAIEYGVLGTKTTYCLLTKDDDEVVGYTFVKNVKMKNENVGKLRSLQQAITRKQVLEEREKELHND